MRLAIMELEKNILHLRRLFFFMVLITTITTLLLSYDMRAVSQDTWSCHRRSSLGFIFVVYLRYSLIFPPPFGCNILSFDYRWPVPLGEDPEIDFLRLRYLEGRTRMLGDLALQSMALTGTELWMRDPDTSLRDVGFGIAESWLESTFVWVGLWRIGGFCALMTTPRNIWSVPSDGTLLALPLMQAKTFAQVVWSGDLWWMICDGVSSLRRTWREAAR